MITLDFKIYCSEDQKRHIDEAIKTTQFIRNKSLRLWEDEYKKPKEERKNINGDELNKYATLLGREFDYCKRLGSQARQSGSERAWIAINNFYTRCKDPAIRKKGYPKYKHDVRSVEYKQSGWRILPDFQHIEFTDNNNIGVLKIKDKRRLRNSKKRLEANPKLINYPLDKIKRARIVRKADGYYVQVSIDWSPEARPLVDLNSKQDIKAVGLDVGLTSFYTDTNGKKEKNPRFFRKSAQRLRRLSRRLSKKVERSQNRKRAKQKLAMQHLKVSRQRRDHAVKLAWNVVMSSDIVAIEGLGIKNMVRNHCVAKSISDAGWYQFRRWLEHYGAKYGKHVLAVSARNTSQTCSRCGELKKEKLKLKDRWFVCEHCGLEIDRDLNAAINILKLALAELEEKKLINTAGHAGINVWGDGTSGCLSDWTTKVPSLNQKPSFILDDLVSTR